MPESRAASFRAFLRLSGMHMGPHASKRHSEGNSRENSVGEWETRKAQVSEEVEFLRQGERRSAEPQSLTFDLFLLLQDGAAWGTRHGARE